VGLGPRCGLIAVAKRRGSPPGIEPAFFSRPACSTANVLMHSVIAFSSAFRLIVDVGGAIVLLSPASSCHTPFDHCQFFSGVMYGTGNSVQWNYLDEEPFSKNVHFLSIIS
jgi:hypothetical protein